MHMTHAMAAPLVALRASIFSRQHRGATKAVESTTITSRERSSELWGE